MIWKSDIGKKKKLSRFLDKAPDIRDLELRSRLNKFCNGREFFNRGDDFPFFCHVLLHKRRNSYTDGHLFVLDGETPPGNTGEKLILKELLAKFFQSKSNGLVLSPFLAALLLFFEGKETSVKNFLIELYRNLTIEVLSSDNDSILEISAIISLFAEISVRLGNAIFANHERARLKMKKQEEKISTKCDFFDDDNDDKKDFLDDISIKIKEDFHNDNNDDVVIKWESDTQMNDAESIPYASPKWKHDVGDKETNFYTLPIRDIEDEIDEKVSKEPKLETPAQIEIQKFIEKIF